MKRTRIDCRIVNDGQLMPDGTRQYAEGKYMNAVDTFSKEFKIDGHCGLHFGMTLNPAGNEVG